MASIKGEKSSSKVVMLLTLAFFGVLFWFLADLILPLYRWTKVDFEKIAIETRIPVSQLAEKKAYLIRADKRKKVDNDPYGWQILNEKIENTPDWVVDEDGDKINEYKTLVRVMLISDRTGLEPRRLEMNVGHTHNDKYFQVEGWRLPPGSLGLGSKRSILLVDMMSVTKLEIGKALGFDQQIKQDLSRPTDTSWISDDDWPARYDGQGGTPPE